MKKTLLGFMLSVSLIAGMAVTASADDTTSNKSNGQVGFEKGSITIDNQNNGTDTDAANLDFGLKNKIDSTTDSYPNVNTDAKISVSDLRGDPTGWNLSVAQDSYFETTDKDTLNGSKITLVSSYSTGSSNSGEEAPTLVKKVELNPEDGSTPFMTAASGQGNGNSIADISQSTLSVPANSARLANKTYSTTLTWELTSQPGNQ
ncbi:WxL domain-containing protein [Lactiplantibacillus garii]|uniref:WxL domain-containing protein n=1 Tax=Lactiplantibacillus garii TaxID=2306423 RepID=A0A3R8L0T3_9LACO|nr:WxL domain-containing protein [Lactiplantibacillus garii]RRK10318.1 WxL domain-containing protein [Lactiplantibacillus garii]